MTRDPNSYIQASAEALAETLASKNQDYAPAGEFSNFERAAEMAGTSVIQVITAQLAIKLTRIQALLQTASPENESLKDSFRDAAGYAAIGDAYLQYLNGEAEPAKPFDYRLTTRNSVTGETFNSAFDSFVENRAKIREAFDE